MVKITHGIVEVLDKDMEWKGIIVIDDIVSPTPIVTGLLFDVDNLDAKEPLAARRGLPVDRSNLTNYLYYNTSFSETWITPSEVKKAFQVKKVKEGWSLVFYLMDVLEKQWGDGKVRLVVWFSG